MAAAPFVLGSAIGESPLYVRLADAPVGEPCHPDAAPMTVTPVASLPRDAPEFVTPTRAALGLLGSGHKPCEQSSTEADGETNSEVDLASLPSEPSDDVSEPIAPALPIDLTAMAMLSAHTLLPQVAAPTMAQHVKRQFHKSSLCKHFSKGRCKAGRACNFAHSQDELEVVPDLTKTKLCFMYFRGLCSKSECGFAHGYEELRCTGSLYKTELCFQWSAMGGCKAGAHCRYAHGESELRTV